MAIQPTTSATAATTTDTTKKSDAAGNQILGKDDFLKLMVAQMAQFSSLEQITNLASATQELATRMSLTQNVGLLGHDVTYTKADGTAGTGKVDGLDLTADGSATLSVAGQAGIDPTTVTAVR